MQNYKVGDITTGCVTGIENYGIFVSLDNYYSGLIHISEISDDFVKNVNDYVHIGETIKVRVLEVNSEECHLKLSIKNIEYKKKVVVRRKRIKETSLGFNTLEYKLPIWIEESLKKIKNN